MELRSESLCLHSPKHGTVSRVQVRTLAFHGWSPSGSMWQPLKLRCQCQDDSRWFKMIKIFQTSFNIFQHVSKCYKSPEFLRSHLSSVPNCCTFDTPSTTPSTPAPRGPGRMRSVSLRCRLRRSARAWTPGWRWWWGHPARGRRIPQCRQGQDMAGRWDLGSEENRDMCRLIQIETVITWRLGVILSLSNLSA